VSTEGSVVGERYRLDQPIGRGRAGIVWLAFDTRLHRTVALKPMFIPTGLAPAQTEQARVQALEEGRNATRVVHGCAITVHDVFREGTEIWLVMEYIPSRSMAQFLAEHGRLTPEQAAQLGIQLGSTLAAMHAAGIVHKTLEPGNVLLADDGGVKITDIGITGGGPRAAYRAPEVARGEPAVPASDVFSLGATLYTAVEGVPPFGQDGQGTPPAPHNAGPLTGALIKLLRSDPVTRPTMNDTVRSLGAITEGRQTAFIPPTAPAMPTMPVSRPTPPAPMPAQNAPQQNSLPPNGLPQNIAVQNPGPPNMPAPTRYSAVPPQAAPAQSSAAGSADQRKWILTALAVLGAIVIGILVSQLFFV
jgi:serine/threonine protein kinase